MKMKAKMKTKIKAKTKAKMKMKTKAQMKARCRMKSPSVQMKTKAKMKMRASASVIPAVLFHKTPIPCFASKCHSEFVENPLKFAVFIKTLYQLVAAAWPDNLFSQIFSNDF